ncbi:MAG: hypothetical protein B7Z73_02960 [Planctomycetia bacterium 21-64-5]|nr:MAG: hypothetical protein B7Z73_02960 [Planctomycetia bacterium 21-64-5]
MLLTTVDRVPSGGPYLFPDERLVEEWRRKLPTTEGFQVGICWQGSVRQPVDRQRSIPLENFLALAEISGVELISLQKGGGPQIAAMGDGGGNGGPALASSLVPLYDDGGAHGGGGAGPPEESLACPVAAEGQKIWFLHGERDQSRGAFVDTAAIIMGLDLVITLDTSIAHLAGGLGMPVWVLLPHAADWRWLLDRDDSPWYPTVRLFRQSSPGDWQGVFRRVAEALRELVAVRTLTGSPAAARTLTRSVSEASRLPVLAYASGLCRPTSNPAYAQGSRVWNRRGIAAAERGRLEEAVSLFRRAVRFQPDSPEMRSNLGNALRNHGDLADAAEQLQQAIALKADYAEAHHNLGLVRARERRFEEAIACFEKALECKPDFAQCRNSLGVALADVRRFADAEASFRRAIEPWGGLPRPSATDGRPGKAAPQGPFVARAMNNLGNALSQQGKRAEAAKCFERATKIDSQFADAYNNLGNVLRELGRHAKAIAAFERALAIRPKFAEAHNNLGIAWSARRNYDQALACYAEALRLWPDYAAAHNNRGIALANRGDWADAIVNYRRALELKPDYAEAMNNLGIVLSQQGEYEEAIALYKRAIELKPDYAEAFSNMGITLTECRRIDEALEGYAQALEHKENYPDARMNRALSYLIRGDFERGWREYEWRWKCKDFNARKFGKPAWDGSPLHGRRIMFHAEQGFGDTFQFIRYARLVKERYDCTVILWCPKQLVPLVREIPYIDEVTIEGEPIPEIDVHLPLLSLPMVFGTTVETVPGEVPYLYAKPELIERWRKELSYIGALKIGIAWKGNPRYRGDRHRSIPLERFAPLADIPGVRLIGLQKGLGTEQIAQLNDRFSLTELPASRDEAAGSFMDTAAILKNIDLVISCDSSLTHLAGGLGVPVWLAQSLASDWRWLLNRDDSPWYPALRIFRQKTLGDWEEVFERMAGELRALV